MAVRIPDKIVVFLLAHKLAVAFAVGGVLAFINVDVRRYWWLFIKRFWEECRNTGRKELLSSALVAGAYFLVQTAARETDALKTAMESLWALLIVLIGWAGYHFLSTPSLLRKEESFIVNPPNLHFESILRGTMGSGIYQRPKLSLFFRNHPKSTEAVATASIRAALRWKRGDEILDVSPLTWLGSKETAINIGVGETAELIIGVQNPGGMWDFGVNENVGPSDAIWIDAQPFEFEVRLLNTQDGRVLKIPNPLTFRWEWRDTGGHTSRPWIVPIEPPDWTL